MNNNTNIETQATSPRAYLTFSALMKRDATLNDYAEYCYYSNLNKNNPPVKAKLQASIRKEFQFHRSALKRTLTEKNKEGKTPFELMETNIIKGDIKQCLAAWEDLQDWLDSKQITRIDTRKKMDKSLIDSETIYYNEGRR